MGPPFSHPPRKNNEKNTFFRLLGQQCSMNIRQNTTLSDGNVTKQLVELLIVADGKLEMTRDNTRLLVIAGGVASQLENFCGKIFEDCGQVHGSTSTNALCVVALAEMAVKTADRELESSLVDNKKCGWVLY